MKKFSFLPLLIVLFSACPALAAKHDLWGDLEAGPHAVGFRLIREIDHSRTYYEKTDHEGHPRTGDRDRLIRIYLWYPARKTDASPFPFKKYADFASGDFGLYPEENRAPGSIDPAIPIARGFSAEGLTRLLDTPTAAVENAKPCKESYPLIVFGQGLYYESPITHAVLCEFLASHGYVVATCPLKGTHSRLVSLIVRDLETQVRDMEFVLSYCHDLPFVKSSILGLAGFDLGGMAAVLLQMRNPKVQALVTLDAGVLFMHPSELPGNSPHYDMSRFRAPWIHMTRGRAVTENRHLLKDHSLFGKARHADAYLLGFAKTQHVDFTSYALLGIENPVPQYWGPPEADPKQVYTLVCKYVLNFFNAHLRRDPEGLAFLEREPGEQDGSGVSYFIERKKGKPPLPTVDDFINAIFEKNAEAAVRMVRQAKEDRDPFEEEVLNFVGYKFLYFWARPEDAVAIFKLNADLYPGSANVYDSLGEACLAVGQKEQAIRNYQKSLELNPKNENAKAMLRRLR